MECNMQSGQTEQKKIVDEILLISTEHNWGYTVQTTPSGAVIINYTNSHLKNLPKLNLSIYLANDCWITVIGRQIRKFEKADLPKVYKLVYELNAKSAFAKFSVMETEDSMYLQATYDVFPAIVNKTGVSLQMVEEITRVVDKFYPEIESVLG